MENRPRIRLVAVGGPSSVGKTTLINQLIRRRDTVYQRPKSFTSRTRRIGEDGSEYDFLSTEEIKSLHECGALLNLDEAYGNLYGISNSHMRRLCVDGLLPIKEIHPANHEALRNKIDTFISVLVIARTSLQSKRQEDKSRSDVDNEYYSNADPRAFDIVLRFDPTDPIDDVIDSLHCAISAELANKELFASEVAVLNRIGYDSLAAEFTDDFRETTRDFHRLSKDFLVEAIRLYVGPAQDVLEIGPGSGWLRTTLRWPQVNYTAVDISPAMLQWPAHGDQRVLASADRLPFGSMTFDCVFGVLMDPFCYPKALCEIRRVTKRSGHFILVVPCADWSNRIRVAETKDRTEFVRSDGHRVTVASFTHSLRDLSKLLAECGLEIVEERNLSSLSIGRLVVVLSRHQKRCWSARRSSYS